MAPGEKPLWTRGKSPLCTRCSHTLSFHGSGYTECKALGCTCFEFVCEETPHAT
jgi:hypothetical protein